MTKKDPKQIARSPKLDKRGEHVARQIENDIAESGWPVGKVIGSEADLIARYKVSRAVLREAIRLVEHHMVARMRQGPSGGLVVTEQNPDTVARAMSRYLSYAHVGPAELIETRTNIEGQAAELAAQRASDDERMELRTFLAGEPERLMQSRFESKEFHLQVARMSHNPVLYLMIRCLVDLTEDQTHVTGDDRTTAVERIHAAHSKIGESIISGDSSLARYRMATHVAAIAPWLSEAGRRKKIEKSA